MRRATPSTQLVTVLFTDIVSSTDIAREVGDRRWRALVAAHHWIVRQALKRHQGKELDTAGDGFFATFPRPAEAIRCACEVSESVREFGLEIRAGLHLGEAEVMGPKVGGLAVNTGARIMGLGKAGEVLVSATVRDAVAGKDIGFADHGVHQLKGSTATSTSSTSWHSTGSRGSVRSTLPRQLDAASARSRRPGLGAGGGPSRRQAWR